MKEEYKKQIENIKNLLSENKVIYDELLPIIESKAGIINLESIVGGSLQKINNIAFVGLGSYAIYMLFTYYKIPELIGGLYLIIPIILQVIVFIGVGGKVKKFTKFYKWIFFITLLPLFSAFFLFLYSPFWYYL